MRAFDISPLLRSSIGYENLNRLVDLAGRTDGGETAYPPYNIEKLGDGSYRIAMAVAGFSREELDLTVQENTLIVTGVAANDADAGEERVLLPPHDTLGGARTSAGTENGGGCVGPLIRPAKGHEC